MGVCPRVQDVKHPRQRIEFIDKIKSWFLTFSSDAVNLCCIYNVIFHWIYKSVKIESLDQVRAPAGEKNYSDQRDKVLQIRL